MPQPPANLSQLLQRLRDQTEGQDQVSIGDLLAAVGQRSFGPIVLAGLMGS
ncbi:exopolysaccharide biosynthesis protein [Marinobacter sp.]|uniref:exopolysaccharide biosynthesis protein n=1 Tax=Marinobacter sp. TaxID=50741 RepID=UPI0035C6D253